MEKLCEVSSHEAAPQQLACEFVGRLTVAVASVNASKLLSRNRTSITLRKWIRSGLCKLQVAAPLYQPPNMELRLVHRLLKRIVLPLDQ